MFPSPKSSGHTNTFSQGTDSLGYSLYAITVYGHCCEIYSSGSKVWPYVKQGVLLHWACDPAHVFTGVSQTKHARKNVKNVNLYPYNPAIFFHLSRVKCGELTDAQKSFPSNVWTPWTGPFWCEAKMVSSWTPSLGATVHLLSTIFPAQSHGLRCGGAHSHPCCFTFGCKLAPVCSECHKIQIRVITLYVINIFFAWVSSFSLVLPALLERFYDHPGMTLDRRVT